jgi:hypothetical protein
MYVFAIPDMNHDGLSDGLINPADSEGKPWDYFFTDAIDYIGPVGYSADGSGLNGGTPDNNPSCGVAFLAYIDTFWGAGDAVALPVDPSAAPFWAAAKTQKTTSNDGILINTQQAAVTRQTASRIQVVLAESFGIIQNGTEQSFKRIDWTVNGYTNSNVPVNLSGTSLESLYDTLFVRTQDAAGYDIYTYVLPQDIPQGTYSVVLQLRKTEIDTSPYQTISFSSYRG